LAGLFGRNPNKVDTKALIAGRPTYRHPPEREFRWSLIKKRAFVLVTVYSDADRTSLFEIRDVPSVTQVDMVLGAFDAIVTVEGEDEKTIEKAVLAISRTRGVKEAKPLIEIHAEPHGSMKPVIGHPA
jgi:hypothetical protein